MEDLVDVELSDAGEVRILMTRLSDRTSSGEVLFDEAALLYIRHLLALAATVAERIDYGGDWALGMGCTGVAGIPAFQVAPWYSARTATTIIDDPYVAATAATTAALTESPGSVTRQLVGKMLRSLGTADQRAALLTDPE